jgi:hypothetical protein
MRSAILDNRSQPFLAQHGAAHDGLQLTHVIDNFPASLDATRLCRSRRQKYFVGPNSYSAAVPDDLPV